MDLPPEKYGNLLDRPRKRGKSSVQSLYGCTGHFSKSCRKKENSSMRYSVAVARNRFIAEKHRLDISLRKRSLPTSWRNVIFIDKNLGSFLVHVDTNSPT